MNYDCLISLPVDKAEEILKEKSQKYIIKRLKTFKLNSFDTEAVIKAEENQDTVILYVCSFMCNAGM